MSINEMDAKAAEYFALQEQIEQLQAEAEAIKDSLKAVMLDRATEELEGHGWRATWHNTVTNRFDSSAFKKAHADLYTAFCKPATGTRFTLNAIKA